MQKQENLNLSPTGRIIATAITRSNKLSYHIDIIDDEFKVNGHSEAKSAEEKIKSLPIISILNAKLTPAFNKISDTLSAADPQQVFHKQALTTNAQDQFKVKQLLTKAINQSGNNVTAAPKSLSNDYVQSRRAALKLLLVMAIFTLLIGKLILIFSSGREEEFLVYYGVIVTAVIFSTFIVTFLFYKDPYELAKDLPVKDKEYPLVSCMVAVFNEEDIVEQCIHSLVNQSYKDTEIIFVNDCSTDNTKVVLDKYADHPNIKVIHLETNVGKKRALGQAMLEARGKLFAFSDSDSIWAQDAIEKIVEVFNLDPNIGGVSGHCRALNADRNLVTKVQDTWYEGQFSIRKAFESVFGAVTCVSGPLAVFRRAAIYNYVPAWENDKFLGVEFKFATDRTLTGYVLGGGSIGKKLKQEYADSPFVTTEDYKPQDWKIVYCKAAQSWTEVPDSLQRILKQQIRWKKSFIRNMFFTGTFYWRKPLLPVMVYYLHILFVLLGPFISFRHLIYIPLRGNPLSALFYLSGIIFVGFMFGIGYSIENRDPSKSDRWIYRPIMSLVSTLLLSWLIFYSMMTIRKMRWYRA